MALINWNDNMSVNVAEIDRQHKKLIDLINELYDGMMAGKSNEVLGKVLNELIKYTAEHFSTEERYFEKFNFPGALSHKDDHAELVKKITDFKTTFDAGKMVLSMDVMKFLKGWLTNHIQGTDKKYTTCFNENGLR
ncbi:MAG: hemerythrin family protein [Proteobacteria bacterium]|nr:hemerythrin family protein [Pseudomonadota bacterium]